jgi:hypothetical protein
VTLREKRRSLAIPLVLWSAGAGFLTWELIAHPGRPHGGIVGLVALVFGVAAAEAARRMLNNRSLELDAEGFTVHRGWPLKPRHVSWRDTVAFWVDWNTTSDTPTESVAYRRRGSTRGLTEPIGKWPDGRVPTSFGGLEPKTLADYLTEWHHMCVPHGTDDETPSDARLCPRCLGQCEYQWPDGKGGAFYRCVGCKHRFQAEV